MLSNNDNKDNPSNRNYGEYQLHISWTKVLGRKHHFRDSRLPLINVAFSKRNIVTYLAWKTPWTIPTLNMVGGRGTRACHFPNFFVLINMYKTNTYTSYNIDITLIYICNYITLLIFTLFIQANWTNTLHYLQYQHYNYIYIALLIFLLLFSKFYLSWKKNVHYLRKKVFFSFF